ncbi:MAG TPA: hypothetical protein PLC81_08865 [Bacteroidales bacterium]|nr:hypothetical protein [Bacteroidales bacterium]
MIKGFVRLLLALLFLPCTVNGQKDKLSSFPCSPPRIFESDSVLNIIIFANFDSLLNDRYNEPFRRPAKVRYRDSCGNQRTISASVSIRGRFRKRPENCSFPSLRLYFKPDSVRNTIYEGMKSVKMVVQCRPENYQFEQYVIGEYLIYRWYQRISNYSFNVQLIRCTYSNLGESFPDMVGYAVLLETKGSFEKRMQGKFRNTDEISLTELDQEEYKKLCFFQYMIMNNDWAASILHNVEIFEPGYGQSPVAIPFDFDFAGILGIPYRIPSATNDTILKPNRDFKGIYSSRKEVIQTIRFFNKNRRFFYATLSKNPYLNVETKEKMAASLDEFYFTINFPPYRKKYIFHRN